MPEPILTRYLQPLLGGRRSECFRIIRESLAEGVPAATLITEVVCPAMAQVDRLYRNDRINTATEHMAVRINRTVADQLQAHLEERPPCGRRALLACADGPAEETGAQITADLFQADGWEVYFVGAGVPEDELLALVGQLRPAVLILFGTQPDAVPETRRLVELIREVDACPTMNILVSGGVFNRADGLWAEVGADVFAPDARELLKIANELGPRTGNPPRVGLVKKRRRKRKASLTAT